MTDAATSAKRDWVASRGGFMIAWGVPIAALVGGVALWYPPERIWGKVVAGS